MMIPIKNVNVFSSYSYVLFLLSGRKESYDEKDASDEDGNDYFDLWVSWEVDESRKTWVNECSETEKENDDSGDQKNHNFPYPCVICSILG